jgi:hypothetical protein
LENSFLPETFFILVREKERGGSLRKTTSHEGKMSSKAIRSGLAIEGSRYSELSSVVRKASAQEPKPCSISVAVQKSSNFPFLILRKISSRDFSLC